MNLHHHYEAGSFRFWMNDFSVIEISKGWGLALSLELPSEWHEEDRAMLRIHLGWPSIFIGIPWPFNYRFKDHGQCSGPRVGFAFHDASLWLYHGNETGYSKDRSATTTIHMPWYWGSCKNHFVMSKLGMWVDHIGSWEKGKEPDNRRTETYDYIYTLDSGEIQNRKATIYVDKMIWRRFWWPMKMVRESINVDFDDEVGEETGSWKGGTLGCGYDLLPNETPEQCLRRMEREREF